MKRYTDFLAEGRPSQRHPLEGHDYHKKTNAQLEYIAKDAHKAAEAMKSHNTTAENKYRDQANDSATVRYWRQKNGMPDWYKKKYGHIKEEVVVEGSGPKEKQKTPYRDINSPEYRAAVEKQKQRMAKDKAAEPGKKMLKKEEAELDEAMRSGFDYERAARAREQMKAKGFEPGSRPYTWKRIATKPQEPQETPAKKTEDVNAGKFTSGAAKPAFKNPSLVSPQNESAAWQRKEGKNPEGGLNRKGIASYRAENPGSKLSMAVTTPPSKLKPGSKAANRRKSFCARMGGMPGPMKKPNGEPTRKALSLKKWNC